MIRLLSIFLMFAISFNSIATAGVVHIVKHEQISKKAAEEAEHEAHNLILSEVENEGNEEYSFSAEQFCVVLGLFEIPTFALSRSYCLLADVFPIPSSSQPLFILNSVFLI